MITYLNDLANRIGTAWNRFWYRPSDPRPLGVLRLLTGLIACYFLLSFTADLTRWMGPDGILNRTTTQRLTGADSAPYVFHWSYLYWATTPSVLWAMHIGGLLIVAAFTVGLWTRVTNIAACVVVLAYVHRLPMVAGQLEPVLTMIMLYLAIGPSGRWLSIDHWWRQRKSRSGDPAHDLPVNHPSVAANISLRLIQLHLAGLYVTMGLNMLAGDTWWAGEGVWWLIARPESRLIDLTWLAHWPLLINAWTHAVTGFALAAPVLLWWRAGRPLLLVLAALFWLSLAVCTGLVGWALMMLIAHLAFMPVTGIESPAA